jgi:hypothetical protein
MAGCEVVGDAVGGLVVPGADPCDAGCCDRRGRRTDERTDVMRIKQKTSQHRRDFTAVYACEHCDHEVEGRGYDDANFHANVIPFAPCPECNKIAPETAPRTAPDVPAGVVI